MSRYFIIIDKKQVCASTGAHIKLTYLISTLTHFHGNATSMQCSHPSPACRQGLSLHLIPGEVRSGCCSKNSVTVAADGCSSSSRCRSASRNSTAPLIACLVLPTNQVGSNSRSPGPLTNTDVMRLSSTRASWGCCHGNHYCGQ